MVGRKTFFKSAKTDSANIHSTVSVNHAGEAEGLKMQTNGDSFLKELRDAIAKEAWGDVSPRYIGEQCKVELILESVPSVRNCSGASTTSSSFRHHHHHHHHNIYQHHHHQRHWPQQKIQYDRSLQKKTNTNMLQEIWYREDYNIIASAMPFIRWPTVDGNGDDTGNCDANGDGMKKCSATTRALTLGWSRFINDPQHHDNQCFSQQLWEHQPWLHLIPPSPWLLRPHHIVKAPYNRGSHPIADYGYGHDDDAGGSKR